MTFTFTAAVAWDPIGKQAVKNVSFQAYATTDTGYTTPLAITDPFGVAIPGNILNSGSQGVFPQFNQATNSAIVITDPAHTYVWTINCVPTDAAVANFISAPGSATATQLNATYAPLTVSGKGVVRKGELVVNAADYGAIADLSTDVIGPINAALAALPSGRGTVYLPPGDYLANNSNPIIGTSGQAIIGSPGKTRIVRQASGSFGLIRVVGTGTAALTTLAADALAGTQSLTVTSSTGVNVGDYIQVYSNALITPGASNNKGEACYVVAVPDSTHITIRGPLRDSYLVTNSAGVNNLNLQRDFTLADLVLESNNPTTDTTPLVNIRNVRDLHIRGVSCRNNAGPGIQLDTCIGFTVTDYRASNLVDDASTGKFGYALVVSNGAEDGAISGMVAENVRHAFTTTGAPGAGVAGVPRNISISNSVARSTPTTAAWDTHPDGSNITFSGVKAVGCAIGFQGRSPNVVFQDVSANNCGLGILITGDASNARIIDPVITNTRNFNSVYEYGNAIEVRGIGTPTDILIQGALVDTCDHAPIKISRPDTGATGTDPVNVRIINLTAFDGGVATSGRGVLWIEDQVVISTILMVNTVAGNRTAAGKLKYLAEKSGAGAVDGVFVEAKLFSFLVKNLPFAGFNPATVANIRHMDSVQAPNVGRGIRKGSNLYYGAAGALANAIPAANQLALAPIDVDRVCTLNALAAEVNTAGTAGAVVRLGVYTDDGSGVFPSALIVDAGTIDGTVLGAQTITLGTPIVLQPGRYWVGAANQGAPTTGAQLRSVATTGANYMPSSTSSASNMNAGAAQNGVTGALPSTFTTTYGVASTPPRVLMQLT